MIHPNLLDQLEMFVSAAELGTFSATAKKLGRSQNVVSYGISTLEESLNVSLFDRSGHKAVLTKTGVALRRQAENIVDAAHGLSRTANELASGVESVLTIAVDDMIPFDFLEDALIAVEERYPGLELRLNSTSGQDIFRMVTEGHAAMGLGVTLVENLTKHTSAIVGTLQMIPVISPRLMADMPESSFEKSNFDPANQRQIVLSRAQAPESSPDQGVFSTHIWRVPDTKSKLELIQRGFGWGMLPAHQVEQDLTDGTLHQLQLASLKVLPELPIFVFGLIDSPLGPAASLFRDQIAN
ncbi:MAG: LysR family transcriptional regulator [Alphaproteobacteria bacterium]|jgi:DNA-binding transcriptional LysR family regulator|nr:LysR family transcriptional regulator [Alphaproteobacteria bacterium]MBT4082525.1 LysR family transcriptional regulator [Alphaproteobacteria bacterium]MBT4543485.1 LysR family transcriptional regulator [Alphaproteobacteria bacterium]MBT6387885.1 LysR family transcriptional regulator [Alphaproteobacteria bacterium]